MSRLSILCAVFAAALFALMSGPSLPVNAAADLGPAIGARTPDIGNPPDQTGAPFSASGAPAPPAPRSVRPKRPIRSTHLKR